MGKKKNISHQKNKKIIEKSLEEVGEFGAFLYKVKGVDLKIDAYSP